MKVLIVEDEQELMTFLQRGLREEGYRVDAAFDGQLGLSMALHDDYDVVILDVNLPGLNGFQVCQRLRADKPTVPVLMLTALGGIAHKKEGYGADDYLAKPFEFDELLLRLQALYKRFRELGTHRILRVADLELNSSTKQVQRAGPQPGHPRVRPAGVSDAQQRAHRLAGGHRRKLTRISTPS
jgi:two-component system copper resistance phosphate regulon response regulator CusR